MREVVVSVDENDLTCSDHTLFLTLGQDLDVRVAFSAGVYVSPLGDAIAAVGFVDEQHLPADPVTTFQYR